jgi:hypothetical protein
MPTARTPIRALPTIEYATIEFKGGLDQVTPVLRLDPGVPRDALNYECAITGGHTRIGGYERYDGRFKPADATYSIIQVTGFANVPSVGQTLTGQTTGTTATIVAVDEAKNYMAVTLIVGAGFSTSEIVKVGTTTIGVATIVTVFVNARSNSIYLNAAADVYRALIAAPPGSGAIRGVFSMVNGNVHEVFAFRNNAGGTACVLHKASVSGWTVVPYLHEVAFTGGSVAPTEGLTITQGANSATVRRVMVESGTWGGGTAAGRLIITAPTPGNFSAGALTTGGTLTLAGAQTAITMLPSGTFEFDVGNFSGAAGTQRIYGCDGSNRCFEFDGVTLAPIKTGLTTDAPTHIAVHQNHLFVSYKSSVLHSGIGTPFNFTALAGAAEYGTSFVVTGFKVQPGAQDTPSILITLTHGLRIMYGSAAAGSNPFRLVNFHTETGGAARSLQTLDRSYFLGATGVLDLARVQEFGNFAAASLTFSMQPYVESKRTLVSASCTHKTKSQYRLFFSDGSGLYLTIVNGKPVGAMPILFPNPVTCAFNGQLSNGVEVIYFGSTNGMVYQLERGSSFDGEAIDYYLTPNWASMKSPRILKSYRKASLEMYGDSYAEVVFSYHRGYSSPEYAEQSGITYASNFQGVPRWDSGITWDAFVWDGSTLGPTEIEVSGDGENIRGRLGGSSDYIYPFTVSSLTFSYIPRRGIK